MPQDDASIPLIRGPEDLAEGARQLAAREPRFATALERTGPLPLRLRPDGFRGLLDIIVSQQVSVASADAIRARLDAAGIFDEDGVLRAAETGLRAAGFSAAKCRYALALAEAQLDYSALRAAPDGDVVSALTAIKGIGPWTAQVYLLFCLGRCDVFPAGDLALQVAAQALFELDARPSTQELEQIALDWSPWRSVAARTLFAYYRVLKNREGV